MKRASIILFLAAASPLLAQRDSTRRSATDSLVSRRVSHVTVTTVRSLARTTRGSQPLSILDGRTIEATGARDPSDVVASVPGVFVRQYGGAGGMRTVALRGTGAEGTVVTVDGVRYGGTASGVFDFSRLPIASVEQVEVVRGGTTALAGPNATGGVVNIVTAGRIDSTLRLRLGATLGSFGEQTFDVQGEIPLGESQFDIDATRSDLRGDYPFLFNEFGAERTVQRENADLRLTSAHLGWRWRPEQGRSISGTIFVNDGERGVPGAVVQGNIEQLRARLAERDLFVVGRIAFDPDPLGWEVALSARAGRTHYTDPDARSLGPNGADEEFEARDLAAVGRLRVLASSTLMLDGTLELRDELLEGESLDPEAGDRVERVNAGVAALLHWSDEESTGGWERSVDAALRVDMFNTLPPGLAPSLGGVLQLGELPVRFRTHLFSGYRAPSFAEQYYLNVGNTRLRPERSLGVDGGITVELAESIGMECTGFFTSTRDRIVAVPRSPVSWSAVNIGEVESAGLELAGTGRFLEDRLAARVAYTRSDARDRTEGPTSGTLLPYAPQEVFSGALDAAVLEWELGRWSIAASGLYTGFRYAQPGEDIATLLPSTFTLDLSSRVRARVGPFVLSARGECTNVTDTRYQIVRNYPMPGRSWRLSIGLAWSMEQ